MKIKVKNKNSFESSVFGGELLIQYFPKLLTDGVEVEKSGDLYYLLDDEGKTYDTCFLSKEEMSKVISI